jgi:hypothetical protein
MISFIFSSLIAQVPYCGWNYGVEITPEDAWLTGCFIPSWKNDGSGTQIKIDVFSPGGVRATPVPPRQPNPIWIPSKQ